MKKIFLITALILSTFSFKAYAKTEGSYLNIYALNTDFNKRRRNNYEANDSNLSVGASYQYAFNFDRFFIAPVVFYDHNATRLNFQDGNGVLEEQLLYSYGAKLNWGFDVTDKLAIYTSYGYVENRLHFREFNRENPEEVDLNRLTQEGRIMGIGANYYFTDNLGASFLYEHSQFDIDNLGTLSEKQLETNLIKVGLLYNF